MVISLEIDFDQQVFGNIYNEGAILPKEIYKIIHNYLFDFISTTRNLKDMPILIIKDIIYCTDIIFFTSKNVSKSKNIYYIINYQVYVKRLLYDIRDMKIYKKKLYILCNSILYVYNGLTMEFIKEEQLNICYNHIAINKNEIILAISDNLYIFDNINNICYLSVNTSDIIHKLRYVNKNLYSVNNNKIIKYDNKYNQIQQFNFKIFKNKIGSIDITKKYIFVSNYNNFRELYVYDINYIEPIFKIKLNLPTTHKLFTGLKATNNNDNFIFLINSYYKNITRIHTL
jgi:hypothetical protein